MQGCQGTDVSRGEVPNGTSRPEGRVPCTPEKKKRGGGTSGERVRNSLKVCTRDVREGSETYSVRIRGQGGRAGGYAYCKYYTAVRAGMCKKGRGWGGWKGREKKKEMLNKERANVQGRRERCRLKVASRSNARDEHNPLIVILYSRPEE